MVTMKLSSMPATIRILTGPFVASLVLAPFLHAQMGQMRQMGPMAPPSTMGQTNAIENEMQLLGDAQTQSGPGIDPREVAAYKDFYSVKPEEMDKKIRLGQAFVQKFPRSPLVEAVQSGLVTAYYVKQDWKDFFATAESALARKPDDVDVLTTVGWVIPHFVNPTDADAVQRLQKAETYERRAIQALRTIPKPDSLTDAQFGALKAQKLAEAHSALGLVYFRRHDFEDSAKELEQATHDNPSPDQTDFFVLGMDLENMNRNAEAADAYGRCVQVAGTLQDRCRQKADTVKKQAPQAR
jgi:Flp pilus assembly protein TadD